MSEPSTESVLDRIVARTRALYSLPTVAARVIELADQDMVDARALRDCIEVDPALVAKLLRVANSSMFGQRKEVKDLSQAIGLLGIKSLKVLVLGFSLPSDLTKQIPPETLQRFWRHTLYRAVAARSFAGRIWRLSGDDAFLAGLLGGVGMLALIQDLGETYQTFLDHVWNSNGDVAEQELQVLGFDHAVLSARMLGHWGLPSAICQAISHPRVTSKILELSSDEKMLAGSLHLGELAAAFLVSAKEENFERLRIEAARLAGWSAEDVEAALAALESDIAPLSELFAIPAPQSGEFARLVAQSQARLAQLAESMIQDTEGDRAYLNVLHEANDLHRQLRSVLDDSDRNSANEKVRSGHAPSSTPRPASAIVSTVSLPARVAAAIDDCRVRRAPLSLVIVSVDRFDELILTAGLKEAKSFVAWLEAACRDLMNEDDRMVACGDARFSLVLVDQSRSDAVSIGRRIIANIQKHRQSHHIECTARTSIGVASVALPPRNFSETDLIEAAKRCLQAAQATGGDTVKSIEM